MRMVYVLTRLCESTDYYAVMQDVTVCCDYHTAYNKMKDEYYGTLQTLKEYGDIDPSKFEDIGEPYIMDTEAFLSHGDSCDHTRHSWKIWTTRVED